MRMKMRRKVTSVSRIPANVVEGGKGSFSLGVPQRAPSSVLCQRSWLLDPHMLTKLISREMPSPEGLAVGEDHLVFQLQPISLWGV